MISIIIPIYNRENNLPQCIESILLQTYNDWELILVDDGSTDKSLEICKFYEKSDNRIRVIHKKNAGVSSARNAGLDSAKGKWIMFVDSDDFVSTNCLEELAKGKEYDLSFIGINRYNLDKNIERKMFSFNKSIIDFSKKDCSKLFIQYDLLAIGYPWGKLFKKSIIDSNSIRFNEQLNIHEDHLFYFDYLIHSKSAYLSDVQGYYYTYSSKIKTLTSVIPSYNSLLFASDQFMKRYPVLFAHIKLNNNKYIQRITTEYGIDTRRKAIYSMYFHNITKKERLSILKRESTVFKGSYQKYGYHPKFKKHLIILKITYTKWFSTRFKDLLLLSIYKRKNLI